MRNFHESYAFLFLMNPYSIARAWWRLLIPKRELAGAKSGDRIRIPGVSIDIVWSHFLVMRIICFYSHRNEFNVVYDSLYTHAVAI